MNKPQRPHGGWTLASATLVTWISAYANAAETDAEWRTVYDLLRHRIRLPFGLVLVSSTAMRNAKRLLVASFDEQMPGYGAAQRAYDRLTGVIGVLVMAVVVAVYVIVYASR